MVVHATVYYKDLYEKRRTTKDPSQRDQQQGKCFYNIALIHKIKLNSIQVRQETAVMIS